MAPKSIKMKKVLFRKAGLLVAGPTTGKTTLLSNLKKQGVNDLIDTDVITERLIPEYFSEKWYTRMHSPDGRFAAKCRDLIIANWLLGHQNEYPVCLSNLWSTEFFTALLGANVKAPLYVFRPDFRRISNLSAQRGSKLSEGLTSKWVASSESYAPRVFEHVIWLPNDLYLSDVVTLKGASWSLTDIGKSLLGRSADDVKRLGNWHRGPIPGSDVKGGSNG